MSQQEAISPKQKKATLTKELLAKAEFLHKVGIFGFIFFIILVYELSTAWQTNKPFMLLSAFMTVFSLAFFIFMQRIIKVLKNAPTDEELIKWGDFLAIYYVPKFILHKKRSHK